MATLWRTPRDWEGKESDGDDADRLGTANDGNRFDLTEEISNLLNETMPGKATAEGELFQAVGVNEIEPLAPGTGDGRAYRVVENSNGDLEVGIEDAGDVLLAAYPTENENDLIVGDANGAPTNLQAPNSTTEYLLFTNANGDVVWRTRGGTEFSP